MGLKTSASGQALNAAGQPISGLYACGNNQASPFRGFYPGGGSTLGPAIVGAYLAVQSLETVTRRQPLRPPPYQDDI